MIAFDQTDLLGSSGTPDWTIPSRQQCTEKFVGLSQVLVGAFRVDISDCHNRANGLARTTLSALVGLNPQTAFCFINTIHWTNINARLIFALNASI
jgi:hypothetical protein